MEEIVTSKLARDHVYRDEAVVGSRRQQIVNEDGLSGPDLSDNDDQAFGMAHPIDHVGHRSVVHGVFKKEPRIEGELESRGSGPVKSRIHHLRKPN